ncbi:MAG TPA: MBL fold metallo-hydrolase [Vicinamibacterales bacterium]|nr:MBL fold metallo-hydrolase [Vicinamibacterales bacterium]
MTGRREFLQILTGAATFAWPRVAWAQAAPATTKLTDTVTLISGMGNNVIVLSSSDGSLLVDAGDAAHAAGLLKVTGRVSTVFNTHYHLESTGGNDVMAQAGATIVAHMNTRLWMTQEIIRDWEGGKVYPPRAKAALPAQAFREPKGEMTIGGERIEYGLLTQAHTDGDIFVHFRNANVLAVGDAVQPGRLPTLDWFCGGWIGGMHNAQKALLDRVDDQTKIVPASGPVITKADLQASFATVGRIREKLVGLVKKGQGAQNLIDAGAVDEFKDVMPGDAATFLYTAYRGLWAHARELGGVV